MNSKTIRPNLDPITTQIFNLSGKSAIVTGAGRGIGEAIATGLAIFGADVVVVDVDDKSANKIAEKINKLGRKSLAIKTDVSDYDQVCTMAKEVLNVFEKIDILINNAGILSLAEFPFISKEEWHKTLKINLDSVFFCSKVIAEHMIARESGAIINMGSSFSSRGAIFNSAAGGPDYVASKAAIQALTRSMAQFLAPYGIRVNAIAPGPVDTPMHADRRQIILKDIPHIPLGRLGVGDDFVGPVIFLVSNASRFITGQTLHVNGGMIMVD